MKPQAFIRPVLLILAFTPTLAFAQAQDETGPISSERPGFTNGTDTVPVGKYQIEAGYQYSRDGRESEHEIGNGTQLRYGVSPRAEIRFGIPSYDWISGSGDSGETRGRSDSAFSAKWRLLDGLQTRRPSLALILSTTLPTGSRAFRENHLQPQAALESHFDFSEKFTLEANFVLAAARSDGRRFAQYSGALNLGYSASHALGIFVETYRISPSDYGSVSGNFLDGGLTYLVGNNTQFDINGGTGVTRGVRSGLFVGAGIAHRFK
jgi:hypothetical protein